jgi:hypothetical protein
MEGGGGGVSGSGGGAASVAAGIRVADVAEDIGGRTGVPGFGGREGCRGLAAMGRGPGDANASGARRLVSSGVGLGVGDTAVSFSAAGGASAGFGVLFFARAIAFARNFLRCSMRTSSSLTFFTKSFTSPGL